MSVSYKHNKILFGGTGRKPPKDGFNVSQNDLFTAGYAAIDYIKSQKEGARCFVIAEEGLKQDFERYGIHVANDTGPVDYVVVGHDSSLYFKTLDTAFRHIMNDAGFIGIHKSRRYPAEDGFHISAGLFVHGLEFATGKEATIIGKPNPRFFKSAMERIGAKKNETVMVGDDIFDDIRGAQDYGLMVVFVESGKSKKEDLESYNIKPDFVLPTIANIRDVLK